MHAPPGQCSVASAVPACASVNSLRRSVAPRSFGCHNSAITIAVTKPHLRKQSYANYRANSGRYPSL